MRIISFLSHKGGVGKSTCCLNLAASLGELGRRVLLIDLDSNACISRTFGQVAALENSIAAALLGLIPLPNLITATPLRGVVLVAGSTSLSALDSLPVEDPARCNERGGCSDSALALELSALPEAAFDYVLLDCPGGQLTMERQALLACDEVIIPTGLAIYDLYAASPTLQLIGLARQLREHKPCFLGFLPVGVAKHGLPRLFQGELDQYPAPQFSAIRHSARLKSIAASASIDGRVIVTAYPDSPAAESFRQVAREIEAGGRAGTALGPGPARWPAINDETGSEGDIP
jgi:cellulose biosynthesis protein BcsQ